MSTQSKWEPWQEDIESPMNACCHQRYCAELKRESARLRAGLEVLQKDDALREFLCQLITELREKPWHQTPEQVANRLEEMLYG